MRRMVAYACEVLSAADQKDEAQSALADSIVELTRVGHMPALCYSLRTRATIELRQGRLWQALKTAGEAGAHARPRRRWRGAGHADRARRCLRLLAGVPFPRGRRSCRCRELAPVHRDPGVGARSDLTSCLVPVLGGASAAHEAAKKRAEDVCPAAAPVHKQPPARESRLTSGDFPNAPTGGLWDRHSHDIASPPARASAPAAPRSGPRSTAGPTRTRAAACHARTEADMWERPQEAPGMPQGLVSGRAGPALCRKAELTPDVPIRR